MVASGGLSPLLGALYLTPLDRRMDRLCKGKRLVHYVRYMDAIVLWARTRWELWRAIAALHEEIAALGLRLHRVKRFIGRTTQDFDFLGYQIRAGARLRPSAEGLGLPRTVAYVNVLASFMSERATGNAFGSTCCVGGVGTSAGWFEGWRHQTHLVPRPDPSRPEASARMNARFPSPSASEPGHPVLRQKS